ncbi:HIT domain-containing protein [archaeon]|jgi:histidine triad (HIT) family protein|nr:HIT domain-containing protein [archaeon]MBT4373847.1 HIT domain-containing protein [archaeon]MBT4532369.1 HIT domain-containing protein [archaeon]MBT7001750.1 HIT domain-containing protein [archaeon]MBT7281925.1 HIT domain-containing protein [archaeon]
MLSEEQAKQVKEQLIQQIKQTFPPEKQAESISRMEAMNPEQFEEFLIQNKLIQPEGGAPTNPEQQAPTAPQKCIFCSIIDGEIPTNKLDENKIAIATLEINPVSKGHSLIIPKKHLEHSDKLPSQVFTLAKKIAKKIKTKLKPKDVTIVSANVFGHSILNVFPVYENENLGSPRQQTKPEELEKLKNLLETKPKPKRVKKAKTKKIENKKIWLPKRFP